MSAVSAPLHKKAASAADRRRPHLRVVEEPRPRHTLLFVLLYVVVAAGAVFMTVSLNALAAGDAVAAHQLEQQVSTSERQYSQLVADVATLENPERIKQVATSMGMIPAPAPRYLQIDRGLPTDTKDTTTVTAGEKTDPLKPVLSVER